MAEKRQIFRCARCGQIIEVLHGGAGELVCCGTPMELQEPKSRDAAQEKHLPDVTPGEIGTHVQVGIVPHPMMAAHSIEWIEAVLPEGVIRCDLSPGDMPDADFPVPQFRLTAVRAWCNLHGLWENRMPQQPAESSSRS